MGQEYRIAGENEAYLQKLAHYVHKQMENLSQKQNVYSPGRLGILTCLNIADELFKAKEEYHTSSISSLDTVNTLIKKIDNNLEDNSLEKENTSFNKKPIEAMA